MASIVYRDYEDERQLPDIQVLVGGDLSEPYSVFTYRFFLQKWPKLCICVYDTNEKCEDGRDRLIGVLICKAESEHGGVLKGYIAMLAVDKRYRKQGIGSTLVMSGIRRMVDYGCEEVYLETEVRM